MQNANTSPAAQPQRDRRLAAYAAATAATGLAAASADGAIVAHTTPVAFGINGEVSIDFNSDNQIDFQIDHDRVNVAGNNLDYLQVDKNDANSAADPLPYPGFGGSFEQMPFAVNGTVANDASQVLSFFNPDASVVNLGGYVAALKQGDSIGPTPLTDTLWDYQEGDNINGTGKSVRANRLIDEDAGQIDMAVGGKTAAQIYTPYRPDPPSPTLDDFIGLNGETRYVGVRVELNDAQPGVDNLGAKYYGWIGVRIDNEADATGTVTGWAYESTPDTPITAGDTGPAAPGDYNRNGRVDGEDFLLWQQQFNSSVTAGTGADGTNDGQVNTSDFNLWKGAFGTATGAGAAVPEPATGLSALLGGALVAASWALKRRRARGAS